MGSSGLNELLVSNNSSFLVTQEPLTTNSLWQTGTKNCFVHRRTGRCGVLAIATWAAWFRAAQGRLLTKKKEERKGRKGKKKKERKKEREKKTRHVAVTDGVPCRL